MHAIATEGVSSRYSHECASSDRAIHQKRQPCIKRTNCQMNRPFNSSSGQFSIMRNLFGYRVIVKTNLLKKRGLGPRKMERRYRIVVGETTLQRKDVINTDVAFTQGQERIF